MDNKPKNEFRKQAEKEKVSEQELLERDQKVAYLRFKCKRELRLDDCQHIQTAIDKLLVFDRQLFQLPNSEGRTAILEENKQHLEQLKKQLEVQASGRAEEVILSVLAEKFGVPTTIVDTETETSTEPPELQDE